MNSPRYFLAAVLTAAVTATTAKAQDAGPLALIIPVSARPASLGNAWVAGRDEYVIFHNPALVNSTPGFGFTIGSYAGGDSRTLAAASGVTVGTWNLGWGVHLVDFSAPRASTAYPHAPATLVKSGDADEFSMVAVAAANMTWKGFRIGVAGKYAQDVAPREISSTSLVVVPTRGSVVLGDIGVSHPLWTGLAGLSVQNIAAPYMMGTQSVSVPSQIALGWTAVKQWGGFDYGFATQVTARRQGWISPAAGLDIGWSWIEGYSVNGRVGARRTETDDERPVTLGASFNADRLNLDYGLGFFTGNETVHRLTLRWR